MLCWTRCCKNHQGWGARHHVLAFRRPSPFNPAGDGAEHRGSQPAHPVAPLQAGRRKKNRAANGSELLERPLSSQRCCWMPKYPRSCPVGFNTPKITAAPWIPHSTKKRTKVPLWCWVFNAKRAIYLQERLEAIKGVLNSRCSSASHTHKKEERVEEREGGVACFLEEISSPSMEQPSVEVKATRRVPGLNNDRFLNIFFLF